MGHRLAGARAATLADIADEPMLRSTDPEWDLTTVPLRDVAPSQTVLVTRAGERNPLVARFGAIAVDVLVPPGSAEVTGSER